MYSMENLRSRCDRLLAEAVQKQDEMQIKRLTEAKNLLSEDDCFQKYDQTTLSYLMFRLKYKPKDLPDIMQYHKPIRVYVGRLVVHYPDRKATTGEMYLAPSVEDYGFFPTRGFYKISQDQNYYCLHADGCWHYAPELERWWDRDTCPVSVELLREVTGKVNPRRHDELHGPVTL